MFLSSPKTVVKMATRPGRFAASADVFLFSEMVRIKPREASLFCKIVRGGHRPRRSGEDGMRKKREEASRLSRLAEARLTAVRSNHMRRNKRRVISTEF